jgi:hypothetical protein
VRGIDDVVELGWRLDFDFERKLAWGCMGGGVHPSLYRGVGGV